LAAEEAAWTDTYEEKDMSIGKGVSRNDLFVAAVLVVFGFFGISIANAADQPCYNRTSLQGHYAIITIYGDNVAQALGGRYYDGNGNFTGSFVINEPTAGSATGDRTLVSGSQAGTYTVNCDGTGVISRVVTLSDGSTAIQADDFVITGATVIANSHGPFFPLQLLATEIKDAGRIPSPIVSSGLFVTHKHTRLPDRQTGAQ
jgi:hypothetical protein